MAEKKPKDSGQAEVQKNVDAEEEKGFRGVEVDPTPNSEFSIQSGPKSPTAEEQRAALKEKDCSPRSRSAAANG